MHTLFFTIEYHRLADIEMKTYPTELHLNWDRPREHWPAGDGGSPEDGSLPLDAGDLHRELESVIRGESVLRILRQFAHVFDIHASNFCSEFRRLTTL
jgi:hypothetical protein